MLLGTEGGQFIHERLALGAWLDERPVGLAFFSRPFGALLADSRESVAGALAGREASDGAGVPPAPGTPDSPRRQLLSIMVLPLLRRCGIGGRLLAHGERLALASGTHSLRAEHSSRLAARVAFEALLARGKWRAPAELHFRLAGRASWALRAEVDWAPFLSRLAERGFTTTDWVGLGESERAQVRHLVENVMPEEHRQFDPFGPHNQIAAVPELSVMLRRHGRIVGWIQASQGALTGSFHYSFGYVLPEMQRLGWMVAGVWDVSRRQAELHGSRSLCVFETAHTNVNMRRFMESRLTPYCEWTDFHYLSEKELHPAL